MREPEARRSRPLSIEQFGSPSHELIPARAGPDQLNGRTDQLPDAVDVVAAALRQVVPAPGRADLLLPPRHLLIDRRAVLVVGDVGDRVVVAGAPEVVSGADLQLRLVVEDVQAHERSDADAVQPGGVAGDGGVEPADAAGAAGHGAELVAALPYLVPHLVRELRRERPVADAGGVRLEDADGEVDPGRWDSAAGQRAARGGI